MYNPSDVGRKGSIFGLPYSIEESDVIIIPVHHDVTTSYSDGTANAPDLILDVSTQLDLSIPNVRNPWEIKVSMHDAIINASEDEIARSKAKNLIEALEAGKAIDLQEQAVVNDYCQKVHNQVEQHCEIFLEKEKIIGVVGGDHSSPLGLLRALSRRFDFGVLQIDAHMDLRDSYEGFHFSHASIMHNALKSDGINSLTQVGIRDYCEEEEVYIQNSSKAINTFYDEVLFSERESNETWLGQVTKIVESLPQNVYISFDIDGLDPSHCPNTGTPVPGGLTYNQILVLLNQLVLSKKRIIGFDLCEVGNSTWDANVGARILYRLITSCGLTNNLLDLK